MKKIKFKRGLIVGPAGIGAVHFREFLKNGFTEIGFIGKSKFKNRSFKINPSKFENIKIVNLKIFKNVKNFRPQVTSICSPFDMHANHILKCKKFSKFIIVEKPFAWSQRKLKKGKNLQISTNLLSKHSNKIVVNLPMVSLAKQLLYKKEIPKKINYFKFCYFTKGKQSYENIAVDLLPHALSFLLTILKKKSIDLKIITIKKQELKWSCVIKLNNTLCNFQFKQDKSSKKSILNFSLNNNNYKRFQKEINNEHVDYLIKNRRKEIVLKNPMNEYLCYLLGSFMNSKNVKINNDLILRIAKIKEELFSFKKI